ncbi:MULTISPECIES: carbon-nitrogen hydrolase family protein [unclassified Roseovarius]|uniref:carbon-nitrogen hydrolase family protein n=1 Tax=unclassified Roseovarius TaxID=2614913 RepID=UPI00273E3252|nr:MULTISPECIES: carbon-nitrogen hydrolase family protein [unclassified Roseovarius]
MRAALVQLNSSDDPSRNLPVTQSLIDEAAGKGARFVLTPEVTNCVSTSRTHQAAVLRTEDDDITLAALRKQTARLGVWLLIGSLALRSDDPDGRFVNRSFLITPEGEIRSRYDKIHMFDVQVSETETYRESAGYRPGERAVLSDVDGHAVGMTICYDLRFPHLFRQLAQAGAGIITVPSAFSPVTGAAHWEVLLRARAIENGCYVLAPAQTGAHLSQAGKERQTYGHSLAIDPWGRVLADAGETPGIKIVDLDPAEVAQARQRIPSLAHGTDFGGL